MVMSQADSPVTREVRSEEPGRGPTAPSAASETSASKLGRRSKAHYAMVCAFDQNRRMGGVGAKAQGVWILRLRPDRRMRPGFPEDAEGALSPLPGASAHCRRGMRFGRTTSLNSVLEGVRSSCSTAPLVAQDRGQYPGTRTSQAVDALLVRGCDPIAPAWPLARGSTLPGSLQPAQPALHTAAPNRHRTGPFGPNPSDTSSTRSRPAPPRVRRR